MAVSVSVGKSESSREFYDRRCLRFLVELLTALLSMAPSWPSVSRLVSESVCPILAVCVTFGK